MNAPAYTVTIHGKALYDEAAPNFGLYSEDDEGSPSDEPYGLLSDAVAAAEKAIATGAFEYNQMALEFVCERVSIRNAWGALLFSGLVKDKEVHWIPFGADSMIPITERLPAWSDRDMHVMVFSNSPEWRGASHGIMRVRDFYAQGPGFDPHGSEGPGTEKAKLVTHWSELIRPV